ncbi:MAG: right-handed parallel beta-helix repeat-containing protein [Planctomycetota bacterium]
MKTQCTKKLTQVGLLVLAGLALFTPNVVGANLEPPDRVDSTTPMLPISSLPHKISAPGLYYLTEDLTTTGTGITVVANDVTIDLSGQQLIGPDSGDNYGIYMNACSNVEIRNGTVRNFGSHGIYEASTRGGKGHHLTSVQAMSNGGKGVFLKGSDHLVKDCTATRNSGDGIDAEYGSTLTGNTTYENQGTGIMVRGNCTVTGNTTYDNQGNGIHTDSSCTVTSNRTSHNQGSGIYTGWGGTVTGNLVDDNQKNGIYTNSSSTVTGNTVDDNQHTGIYTESGCMVSSNKVNGNNRSNAGEHAGIRVFTDCAVKGNTTDYNKQNNIYVVGSGNSIEENIVTNSTNGIYFQTIGNFYANNRASGNTTDYAGCVPTGDGDGGGNKGS